MSIIVKSAFGDYQRGDRITDAAVIKDVLASNPHSVVRVADPAVAEAPAEPVSPPPLKKLTD